MADSDRQAEPLRSSARTGRRNSRDAIDGSDQRERHAESARPQLLRSKRSRPVSHAGEFLVFVSYF
jgi:hypothetical protein